MEAEEFNKRFERLTRQRITHEEFSKRMELLAQNDPRYTVQQFMSLFKKR